MWESKHKPNRSPWGWTETCQFLLPLTLVVWLSCRGWSALSKNWTHIHGPGIREANRGCKGTCSDCRPRRSSYQGGKGADQWQCIWAIKWPQFYSYSTKPTQESVSWPTLIRNTNKIQGNVAQPSQADTLLGFHTLGTSCLNIHILFFQSPKGLASLLSVTPSGIHGLPYCWQRGQKGGSPAINCPISEAHHSCSLFSGQYLITQPWEAAWEAKQCTPCPPRKKETK